MADLRYLACADIQFPLHDTRAIDLLWQAMRYFRPQMIDLVGDIDNSDGASRWVTGTPEETFYGVDTKKTDENELFDIYMRSADANGAGHTREFLTSLRNAFKKSSIHLYDGNHGWTRHESYLTKRAPTLLSRINPDMMYGLKRNGVEWHRYDDLPYNRFNDMYVHHGNAVSKHSGESVKADMDGWGVSLIRGHGHRLGDYHKTLELTGQALEGYEIGHLMDVKKADYMNIRNWQQGFIYGYVGDGHHHMNLVKIKDYTCYVGSRKLVA